MILNAYDTTVGRPFKIADKIENTIRTLHTTRNLTPTKKQNVFLVSHDAAFSVPIFAFPITLQANNRQMITVYDERPFRNKGNNMVVHPNEITITRLAAFLQQDVVEGDLTPLKAARALSTKGFAEAVGSRLGRRAMLDMNEMLTLKVLLAYYYVGLIENISTGLDFIAMNVIRSIYGTDKGYVSGVIENVNHLKTLEDLLQAIHDNPILYKLKAVSLKDFIAVISGISFSALGGKVIAASAEAPCLFTALVFGVVNFKAYNKTQLGMSLDPKYNRDIIETFIRNINYTYDLKG